MFDILIIGSGPAGVSSALAIENKKVAIVDVGHVAASTPFNIHNNLYTSKEQGQDVFAELIGDHFCGVENIFNKNLSPKLKSPQMRFITDVPNFKESAFDVDGFYPVMSYAAGGLANAWGAGVFEFNSSDLKGFPCTVEELKPYYQTLSDHIGISGSNEDDLVDIWGRQNELQEPLSLSPMSLELLRKYSKNKKLFYQSGFRIGRPRLAILTRQHNGRAPFANKNLEFFKPNDSAIYHPGYTLQELIKKDKITYIPHHFVTHFSQIENGVEVFAKNTTTGVWTSLKAKKIIMAAGAISSAAIVLRSFKDVQTKLPLMDNAIAFLPIIFPRLLGTPVQSQFYSGAELCIYKEQTQESSSIQASFYSLAGVMRSDLVREFPFSWKGNMWATRYLSPAVGVAQFFMPDTRAIENSMQINSDDGVILKYTSKKQFQTEGQFARVLRKAGLLSFSFLAKKPIAGSSIHYAGTLPYNTTDKYSTDKNGLLAGTKNIYIADAAVFPSLPSKNLTYTIMANAMRVARHISQQHF